MNANVTITLAKNFCTINRTTWSWLLGYNVGNAFWFSRFRAKSSQKSSGISIIRTFFESFSSAFYIFALCRTAAVFLEPRERNSPFFPITPSHSTYASPRPLFYPHFLALNFLLSVPRRGVSFVACRRITAKNFRLISHNSGLWLFPLILSFTTNCLFAHRHPRET